MTETRQTQHYLSLEEAQQIPNPSERAFALRCLAVGCLLMHQVSVGDSVIDFLVVNPKQEEKTGTLVEVTLLKKMDQQKHTRKVTRKGKVRKISNDTGKRKSRQIEAMRTSGYRWTILYAENLIQMSHASHSQQPIY